MGDVNPWSGLTSIAGMTPDQTFSSQMQGLGQIDPSMLLTAPQIGAQDYGGAVQPGSNGYPVFSTPSTFSDSSPGGLIGTNPIDQTPNAIMAQARGSQLQAPKPALQGPQMANYNPWSITKSSTNDAYSYPLGNNPPPPKINVL
jgi:hypothetical protein